MYIHILYIYIYIHVCVYIYIYTYVDLSLSISLSLSLSIYIYICEPISGKRDSIHHHLLETISETAHVLELRQKLLCATPSGWWRCIESVFRISADPIRPFPMAPRQPPAPTFCFVCIVDVRFCFFFLLYKYIDKQTTNISLSLYICIHTYVYIHMYVYTHMYVCTYVYIYIYVCIYLYICIYINYIYIYIYTHTRTYTHTYVFFRQLRPSQALAGLDALALADLVDPEQGALR